MKIRGVYEKVKGSGVWWIRYADGTGKIRREKAGRKSVAIALVRKRKTQVLEGKKLPENFRKPPVTLAELAGDALEYSRARKRTHREDASRLDVLLAAFGRHTPAETLTPQLIERQLDRLAADRGWAASTVNHHRSLLSLVFSQALRNGKLIVNPVRGTRHRREDNSRARALSEAEETRLRQVITERWPEHMPELDLALHTGLRRGEMFGLQWPDVDFSSRFVHVRRGKNGLGRYARLNTAAIAALIELRRRCDGKGPVIRNLEGTPLQGTKHWFEKAVELAQLRDFRWHDLRHSFASRLAMAGAGLAAIQRALGHKSISMTLRYAHLTEDFMQDVVERIVRPARTEETAGDPKTDTGPAPAQATSQSGVH